jgi:polar amino acid transport system substrate-binding protein
MGYRDENNEIVGFDIDLAREVCKRLGVELTLQPIDWSVKEMELTSGNIDCIWNGMSHTQEREQSMALSLDYMNNKIVLMVKDAAYKTKEELAGKIVAVQSGSFAQEVIDSEKNAAFKATLKEVRAYPDYQTAIMDLQNGNVDAVAIDLVVANYRIASLGDTSLSTIDDLEDDLFCIGFRKEDTELRDAVNQALIEMAKDGTLDTICAKWFGANISIVPQE